jgi:hypothetical protein
VAATAELADEAAASHAGRKIVTSIGVVSGAALVTSQELVLSFGVVARDVRTHIDGSHAAAVARAVRHR